MAMILATDQRFKSRRPIISAFAWRRSASARQSDMAPLQNHIRRTFLAGIFAAIPIAVTAFVIYYVDAQTRILSRHVLGKDVPFLGVALAIVAIISSDLS